MMMDWTLMWMEEFLVPLDSCRWDIAKGFTRLLSLIRYFEEGRWIRFFTYEKSRSSCIVLSLTNDVTLIIRRRILDWYSLPQVQMCCRILVWKIRLFFRLSWDWGQTSLSSVVLFNLLAFSFYVTFPC